jgi:hypothetical protein
LFQSAALQVMPGSLLWITFFFPFNDFLDFLGAPNWGKKVCMVDTLLRVVSTERER